MAVASESCGIALNPDQIQKADGFFRFVLSDFVIFQRECDLLDVNIVEQAITEATTANFNRLEDKIVNGVGVHLNLRRLMFLSVQAVIDSTPDAQVPAAMQANLDEFLLFVNDFCGLPPLSSTALGQLDEYFLVDLVALATGR